MNRIDCIESLDLCRCEDCPRPDLHPPHPIPGRRIRERRITIAAGQVLRDMVYLAVPSRVPKTFGQLYQDVLDEYGSVTERSVYRAIADLRDRRMVALVMPPAGRRIAHREGIRGGYVRYDSPLLWQRDGLRSLQEQVHDLIGNDAN